MRKDETVSCNSCNQIWLRSEMEPDFGHSCDPEENIFSPCCGALCVDRAGRTVNSGGLPWLDGR